MTDELEAVLSTDQIRTMIAIAEQGSFNKAAASLGVRQSAVNQQVVRLEDRIGRRLFARSKPAKRRSGRRRATTRPAAIA